MKLVGSYGARNIHSRTSFWSVDLVNPTIFGTTLSRALGVVIMGSLFVKGSYYFLGVQQIAGAATADIVAYGRYKFVG